MKRDRAYFTDILLSARSIMELTGDRPFEDFFSDTVAFSAVLYRFIIMGEATKRISMESKAAHPEVAITEVFVARPAMRRRRIGLEFQVIAEDAI